MRVDLGGHGRERRAHERREPSGVCAGAAASSTTRRASSAGASSPRSSRCRSWATVGSPRSTVRTAHLTDAPARCRLRRPRRARRWRGRETGHDAGVQRRPTGAQCRPGELEVADVGGPGAVVAPDQDGPRVGVLAGSSAANGRPVGHLHDPGVRYVADQRQQGRSTGAPTEANRSAPSEASSASWAKVSTFEANVGALRSVVSTAARRFRPADGCCRTSTACRARRRSP